MIVKIFKVSTKEMWILRHKKGLIEFVKQEIGIILPSSLKVDDMIRSLPKEDYCRVK